MAEDMIVVTKRELERWPGASVSFSNGGKHITATLSHTNPALLIGALPWMWRCWREFNSR